MANARSAAARRRAPALGAAGSAVGGRGGGGVLLLRATGQCGGDGEGQHQHLGFANDHVWAPAGRRQWLGKVRPEAGAAGMRIAAQLRAGHGATVTSGRGAERVSKVMRSAE